MIPEKQMISPRKQTFGSKASKGDIVLIHGLWMTPLSWEKWVTRYQEKGYHVISPTWPMMEGKTVEHIRKNPEILSGVGVEEIFEHLVHVVSSLENRPIIMGHSFGGLFTQ